MGKVADAIDKALRGRKLPAPRRYIGASNVGHPCEAYLAFSLRGYPEVLPDPQLQRIFALGHKVEDLVVKDMREAGIKVWDRDPLTGRQFAYHEFGSHVRANADGQVEDEGELRLLEIKSANDASFKKFKENGVRFSHPRYYAQMQLEMGLSGIQSCMFVMMNKNNSQYEDEVVTFDAFYYASLVEKIERILRNEAKKVADDPSDWRCRGCFKRGVCWEGQEVPVACATCANALADDGGGWYCTLFGKVTETPCENYMRYEPIPKC